MNAKLIFTIVFIGFFTICSGQPNKTWDKWTGITGEWIGEGSGKPGQGGGYFTFITDLDNNILVRKGHTEIAATGNNPKVIHDDLMVIYPDYSGNPSKAIYFDNE
jgi:hypothetical protein